MSKVQEVPTLGWDEFEVWSRCGKWAQRDRDKMREGGYVVKDATGRVRSAALSDLLASWAALGIGFKDESCDADFVDEASYDAVTRAWLPPSEGKLETSPEEMARECEGLFTRGVGAIRAHARERCKGSDPLTAWCPSGWSEGVLGRKIEISGGSCLLVRTPRGRWVMYMPRATRDPQKVGDDPLRWNASIFLMKFLRGHEFSSAQFPALSHYYYFWQTGEFREVPVLEDYDRSGHGWAIPTVAQRDWQRRRDEVLARVLAGDVSARSSREACHLCPHRPACPERYTPKDRELSASQVLGTGVRRGLDFV